MVGGWEEENGTDKIKVKPCSMPLWKYLKLVV